MAANDHHTTDGPGRHSTATDQLSATGTATSTAAPERARWPRLVAAPQPPLRSMLPRGYVGFTEATTPRHLVLPATASVPLVVKLLDSAHRPPAFVMGARGSAMVLEGDCAPSYLEVVLSPLGACRLLGCPWPSSAASWWTWSRCWGPTAGAWVSSSARPRAGGGAWAGGPVLVGAAGGWAAALARGRLGLGAAGVLWGGGADRSAGP